MKIKCQWIERNRVLVNPDGQVHPCCYLGNVAYMRSDSNNPVLKKYHENKESYNIHNYPLQEIINSDWFKKDLQESWDNPDLTIKQCKDWCGEKE